MKIQSSLLCILAMANASFAADILVTEFHDSADCSGNAVVSVLVPTLANTCVKSDSSSSSFISCSPLQIKTYTTADCTGTAETQESEACSQVSEDPASSAETACESVADNRVARVAIGAGCDEDGKLTSSIGSSIAVIDRCGRQSAAAPSYTLAVGDDDELTLTVFSEVEESCEGASTTTKIKVGECKKVPGAIVGNPAEVFVTIDPAVEGTKLGSNATVNSVNLLALFIAMIGAMTIMA